MAGSKYYPSIEAIDAFAGVTDFVIVPGEEVHLPFNGVHYINFGGSFSINAIVTDANREIYGDDPHYNSIDGNPPKRMTRDEFGASDNRRVKAFGFFFIIKSRLEAVVGKNPFAAENFKGVKGLFFINKAGVVLRECQAGALPIGVRENTEAAAFLNLLIRPFQHGVAHPLRFDFTPLHRGN